LLVLLSGSLRAQSSNSAVLRRCEDLSGDLFDVRMYEALAGLPAFNPDVEELGEPDARFPGAARDWRTLIADADALLISTPEYAHGLPGSLKNALDWLVGSFGFPGMPLGLISTSNRSVHAPAQLLEIVRTMSAVIVDDACVEVDVRVEAQREAHRDGVLRRALEALHAAAVVRQGTRDGHALGMP
jgi:NAD(P)H-dependent FMN reductase